MEKRKVLFIAIICCLFGMTVNAQKRELRVSYGALTSNEFFQVIGDDILSTALTLGNYSSSNSKSLGALSVDYSYALSNRLRVGGAFVFDTNNKDISYDKGVTHAGRINNYYFTVMPQATFAYIAKPCFELYSGLALGASMRREKFNPTSSSTCKKDVNTMFLPAFQVNAIGVRVGKKLAGFAEIGFGAKGIVNAGVSYRF